MVRPRQRLSVVLALALFSVLLLSACNMPGRTTPTLSGASLIYTAAAETVQAQLTNVYQPAPTSRTPVPPAGGANSTPQPSVSASPSPQDTAQAGCDQAKFVEDVTYPDHTQVSPNQTFVKTWRLQNDGSCTWNTEYALVFVEGDDMGASAAVPLVSTVAPGQTVDVSITLTAPNAPGSYRGDWKLRNASGQMFGVGEEAKPFWVQVDVVVASGIVYDFIARASSADWFSGVGENVATPLIFGGDDGDPSGAAKIRDRAPLETGGTSGKLLLTYPRRETDGVVRGVFPAYRVQPGDRFEARLGFLIPDGSCGSGRVVFRLKAQEEDGDVRNLREWRKACNGSLLPVEVDLSDLAGQSVRIVLEVWSDGAPNDDWAIWNSALIEQ